MISDKFELKHEKFQVDELCVETLKILSISINFNGFVLLIDKKV